MSVLVAGPTLNGMMVARVFTKGAAEVVLDKCQAQVDRGTFILLVVAN